MIPGHTDFFDKLNGREQKEPHQRKKDKAREYGGEVNKSLGVADKIA
jgi:hypothetical protein